MPSSSLKIEIFFFLISRKRKTIIVELTEIANINVGSLRGKINLWKKASSVTPTVIVI